MSKFNDGDTAVVVAAPFLPRTYVMSLVGKKVSVMKQFDRDHYFVETEDNRRIILNENALELYSECNFEISSNELDALLGL